MHKAEYNLQNGKPSLSLVYSYCFCYYYYHYKIANTFKPLSPLRRQVQGNGVLSLDSGLVLGKINARLGFR